MENKSDEITVRIEHEKIGRPAILGMSIAFSICVLIFLIIGGTAPPGLISRSFGTHTVIVNRIEHSARWRGRIKGMGKKNRFIWVAACMRRPGYSEPGILTDFSFTYNQNVAISASATTAKGKEILLYDGNVEPKSVTCKMNNEWCNSFLLLELADINHPQYDLNVTFTGLNAIIDENEYYDSIGLQVYVFFMNADYTKFEMGWSYFFLIITIIVMFLPRDGFFWAMAKVPPRKWTSQQIWIAVLLIALWFYDDPFFAGEVNQADAGFSAWYRLVMATFLCLLLLYWLIIIDNVRRNEDFVVDNKTAPTKIVPKTILVGAIWITLVASYFEAKRKEVVDPAYDYKKFNRTDKGLVACISIEMVIYILWIFYLITASFNAGQAMMAPYRFIFGITTFVVIILIIAVFLSAMSPVRASPVGYLSFCGIFNLYVWILAIAYTPFDNDSSFKMAAVARVTHTDIEVVEFDERSQTQPARLTAAPL